MKAATMSWPVPFRALITVSQQLLVELKPEGRISRQVGDVAVQNGSAMVRPHSCAGGARLFRLVQRYRLLACVSAH